MTTKHLLFSWLRPFIITSICLLLLSAKSGEQFPPIQNSTFQQGEYLKFRIHYGFITAGYASLEIKPELVEKNGRQCMHVVGNGWSTPTFDHVFKIRDKYETYIDEASLQSVHFKCKIEEGSFSHYHEAKFDREHNKVTHIQPKKDDADFDVPEGIQDVLSAFFYARASNDHTQLTEGQSISLRNFHSRKMYGLSATLMKREKLKVGGRKYNALKFSLNVDDAGMVTDGSKIHFWMSDDKNKIPLRIKADLMVGSLKIDLEEAKGLRNELSSLVK